MDGSDLFYLALFAFWLLQQVNAVRKRFAEQALRKQEAQAQQSPPPAQPSEAQAPPLPPPQRAPEPPRAPSQRLGEALITNLDDVDAEINATLPELDGPVRAQVAYLHEGDFRKRAGELRSQLSSEGTPEFARAAHQTKQLLSHYRGVLQTGRVHSGLRGRRELKEATLIADRLVAELDQPLGVEEPLPPPVGIVWDAAQDSRLTDSPLSDATLFIPPTVRQDPSHWSFLAPEIARYLGASAPSLYQEIYDGLELGTSEAQVGNDPDALTRVLFASWIGRITSDVMGALFFGPTYLHSIAKLYAQPGAPARVTSIVLNRDGTVGNEPPAHARVHITASWLTRMGYASEANAMRGAWDEQHGSPTAFGFWGSMTSLPAEPILDSAERLTDALYQLPFESFGSKRLEHLPGLSGFESHARQQAAATTAFLAGERAQGSPRAIVAGAIEAALTSPESNATIHTALYRSLAGDAAPRRSATAPQKGRQPRPAPREPVGASNVFASLTGKDVAEALIVGEVLLAPAFAKASAGKPR